MLDDRPDEEPFYKVPSHGTQSALRFFRAANNDMSLFLFVCDLAMRVDYVAHVAREALDGKTVNKKVTPSELARDRPGPSTMRLRSNRQPLLEMMYCRAVDNFQVYLVDVLREVLRKCPHIMKTRKDQLSVEDILRFSSIDDLVSSIIEKKIDALSGEGFEPIAEWFAAKGIPLVVRDTDRPKIIGAIAARNVFVHHRGRVDQRYIDRTGTSTLKLGEVLELSVDDLFAVANVLATLVADSDGQIVGKFQIPSVPLTPAAEADGEEQRAVVEARP
jgi:hypothetical protein